MITLCIQAKISQAMRISLACLITLTLFVTLSSPVLAETTAESTLPRLAVLDFRDEAKLPPFEVSSLADSVRGAALNAPFIVMTKENMLALLPPNTELSECVGECEVEVGRKLGAHYLITGRIGVVDQQLQLLLRLYETQGGSLRGQSTITAPSVGVMQPKVRRAATELLTRLSPSLRSSPTESRTILFVRVKPSNALVKLDGFVIPPARKRATKGGFLVTLEPGKHRVQAEARGYISRSVQIKVRRGEPVEADLRLKRRGRRARCDFGDCEADLFVFTQPSGARIYLNGRDTGLTTKPSSMNPRLGSAALRVPAGDYWVTARKSPFSEASRKITVRADQLSNDFRERPLVLSRPRGHLRIMSDPPGALIRLNGELIGKTPLTKRGVLARPYWLELIHEGYQSREELITIQRGKTWKQSWKLRSSTAKLLVKVRYRGQDIPNASIWLDDRKLGETDDRGELSVKRAESGDHLLQVRHPLYEPSSQALTLHPGKSVKRIVRMREAFGYITIDTSELTEQLARWKSAAARDLRALPKEASAEDTPRQEIKETSDSHLSMIWGGVVLTPPYTKIRVSAGRRWLQVRPPAHAEPVFGPTAKKYLIRVGETITVKPSWSRHHATLSLKSAGVRSEVYLDQERVGQTPYRAKLSTGPHTIKLIADGYTPYQKTLWVTRDGYSEEVDFEKRTLLKLRCGPILGQLMIDGVPVGTSPQTVDVTPGHHQVTCVARGAEVSAPVEVSPGAQLSHSLTISPNLLGAAYRRRARWRQSGVISSGLGIALSVAGAVTLLTSLPDSLERRDQAQRGWLTAVDLESRYALANQWSQAEAEAQNAHLLGWSLLGSGLTLTGGGVAMWWANQERSP